MHLGSRAAGGGGGAGLTRAPRRAGVRCICRPFPSFVLRDDSYAITVAVVSCCWPWTMPVFICACPLVLPPCVARGVAGMHGRRVHVSLHAFPCALCSMDAG